MTLVTRQALLELRDLQQVSRVDESRKFADESNMLGDVASELAKFGVLLDESESKKETRSAAVSDVQVKWKSSPLHIGDSFDLACA